MYPLQSTTFEAGCAVAEPLDGRRLGSKTSSLGGFDDAAPPAGSVRHVLRAIASDAGKARDRKQWLAPVRPLVDRSDATLRARFEADGSVEAFLRGRTRLADGAGVGLLHRARAVVRPDAVVTAIAPVTVLAVGGYGRRELAPASDLDLLFLLGDWAGQRAHAERLIGFVLTGLWDLGFEVGHATRTVPECMELARGDPIVLASLLDARFLAGSFDLHAMLDGDVRQTANSVGAKALAAALAPTVPASQRPTAKDEQEPDVKRGPGALRDIQRLLWLARLDQVGTGSGVRRELAGPATAVPRVLADARRFLWQVRCHLHLLAGRTQDRLVRELQPPSPGASDLAVARTQAPPSSWPATMRTRARCARSCPHPRAGASEGSPACIEQAGAPGSKPHARHDVVRAGADNRKGTAMSANRRGAAERSPRPGLLLAAAAAMLWGTIGVASAMLPDGVALSSFHLGFARLAIAAPLLVLFSALVLGRGLWAIAAQAWPWIAAVGVLAACYQFCLFVSLEQLGVARTALLTVCLPPALIAGASALVCRQRPSAWTTGALLMALGGLMLVGGGSKAHDAVPGAAPLLGLATGILAAVAFASLSALARMLTRYIHPLQAVSFGFVVGAVLLASVVVLSGRAEPGISLGSATTLQLVSVLVYLGAVPTALAYICYFYGMQLSRTATSGIAATLIEPAIAVLLAAGLLGEHLSPAAWLGVACLPFATIVLGLEGSRSMPAASTSPRRHRRFETGAAPRGATTPGRR